MCNPLFPGMKVCSKTREIASRMSSTLFPTEQASAQMFRISPQTVQPTLPWHESLFQNSGHCVENVKSFSPYFENCRQNWAANCALVSKNRSEYAQKLGIHQARKPHADKTRYIHTFSGTAHRFLRPRTLRSWATNVENVKH